MGRKRKVGGTESEQLSINVRLTPTGRRLLDEVATRMGWDIGRAASVCVALSRGQGDKELLEAMREHDRIAAESNETK